MQEGQTEAGLRYLRDARLRSPGNGEIRFHLAWTLNKLGRQAEAREELAAALAGLGGLQIGDDVARLKHELGL